MKMIITMKSINVQHWDGDNNDKIEKEEDNYD